MEKQEQSRRAKKSASLLLLLILLVTVTVGFALLSTSLNIRGNSKIKKGTWDIDPGNITCPEGEVCTINPQDPDGTDPDECTDPTKLGQDGCNGAVIWMDGDTVYFKHVLAKPGDVFTFNVDFSNNGNIDAKISNVDKKAFGINAAGTDNTAANKFMSYDVTYNNGGTVSVGDKLAAGTTKNFKVTVTYKDVKVDGQTVLPTDDELAQINGADSNKGAISLFSVDFEQD